MAVCSNSPSRRLEKTGLQAVQDRHLGATPSQSNHDLVSRAIGADDVDIVDAGGQKMKLGAGESRQMLHHDNRPSGDAPCF